MFNNFRDLVRMFENNVEKSKINHINIKFIFSCVILLNRLVFFKLKVKIVFKPIFVKKQLQKLKTKHLFKISLEALNYW